jgi:hypothetical protein
MAAGGGIIDKIGGMASKGMGMITDVLKQVMGKLKGGSGGGSDPTQMLSGMTDLLKGGS